jgi:hypothetical protein
MSRKLGMDPVVSAFTRGIVIVGEVACAVKGIADPEDMRLFKVIPPGPQGGISYHTSV